VRRPFRQAKKRGEAKGSGQARGGGGPWRDQKIQAKRGSKSKKVCQKAIHVIHKRASGGNKIKKGPKMTQGRVKRISLQGVGPFNAFQKGEKGIKGAHKKGKKSKMKQKRKPGQGQKKINRPSKGVKKRDPKSRKS